MEIRQIKKEIDIRPASYLDENAEYVENRESKKIPLKFRPSLVQINFSRKLQSVSKVLGQMPQNL